MNRKNIYSKLELESFVDALPGIALLALGGILTALTGFRWSASAVAILAPVPFLLYARRMHGPKKALALVGTVMLAQTIATVKLLTAPLSPIMAPLFSLPIGLTVLLPIFLSEIARREAGDAWGLLPFAALTGISDWTWLNLSDYGSLCSLSSNLYGDLGLLQSASLFGLPGLMLVIGAFQYAAASFVGIPSSRGAAARFSIAASIVLALVCFGSIRLERPGGSAATVRAAAIATIVGPTEKGLPSAEAIQENTEALFAKTERAAALGARVIAWNETAVLLAPSEEKAFVERGRGLAKGLGADLLLAYGVLTEGQRLIDNKFVFLTSEGEVAQTYRKHRPVPGEPSMKGTEPLKAISRPYARVAGAICFDYDFPAIAARHFDLGASLVVVPASDWAGCDPSHSLITRIRAIENGFSIVKPTRGAASIVFDQYGKPRGWMAASEADKGMLLVDVPATRVATLYSRLRDWPVLIIAGLCLLGTLGAIVRNVRHRLRG